MTCEAGVARPLPEGVWERLGSGRRPGGAARGVVLDPVGRMVPHANRNTTEPDSTRRTALIALPVRFFLFFFSNSNPLFYNFFY